MIYMKKLLKNNTPIKIAGCALLIGLSFCQFAEADATSCNFANDLITCASGSTDASCLNIIGNNCMAQQADGSAVQIQMQAVNNGLALYYTNQALALAPSSVGATQGPTSGKTSIKQTQKSPSYFSEGNPSTINNDQKIPKQNTKPTKKKNYWF